MSSLQLWCQKNPNKPIVISDLRMQEDVIQLKEWALLSLAFKDLLFVQAILTYRRPMYPISKVLIIG